MKITELRVGNLILSTKGETRVCNINDDGRINKGYSHTPIISSCNGIPLTEQLLFKFGFNSDLEMQIRVAYCKMIYRHDVWNLYNNDSDCVIADLLYVHQLQNLYFTLTNQELEIK